MFCGEIFVNKNICIEFIMYEGFKFKVVIYLYLYFLFWFQCFLVLEVDKVYFCYIQLFDYIVLYLNFCLFEIKIYICIL